jgi:hypothetical protein
MNQEKLMSYSDNPDGIGKTYRTSKDFIAATAGNMDRCFKGRRRPRGSSTIESLIREGKIELDTPRPHRFGSGAINPADYSRRAYRKKLSSVGG